MSFRQVQVSGFPAIALRSAELEAVVVPGLGMKLTNLRRLRGREWLWRNDQLPLSVAVPGASYVETADSGGWDECFPTVAPCAAPGAPDAPLLPDHGELWSAPWDSAVADTAGGTTLTGTVLGSRYPYEFQRQLSLDATEPVLRVRYRLRHLGGESFPWIWSSHPLLNIQPGSVLELPGVRRVRVDAAHGRPDVRHGDTLDWPREITGAQDGLVFGDAAGAPWAMKLFADIGPTGRAIVTDPRRGERLEFRMDPVLVPQIGVWINCGGWAPAGLTPYYNLALEPCIGAPDRLDQAVYEWRTAQLLEPDEERLWGFDVWLPGDADQEDGLR